MEDLNLIPWLEDDIVSVAEAGLILLSYVTMLTSIIEINVHGRLVGCLVIPKLQNGCSCC